MKKITTLTDEQRAKFPQYVEKWIKVGLSTEPADFDRAEEAVREIYKVCELKQPRAILRAASPRDASNKGAEFVRKLIIEAGGTVDPNDTGASNYRGGQFWAGWIGYVDFLITECGWDGDTIPKYLLDKALTESVGWVWWHEEVCVIGDRPAQIFRDEQGRLHCEFDKAIKYRDGWGVYSWHGVTVPEKLIMTPELITVAEIEAEQNAEIKRIMITRYIGKGHLDDMPGEARYLVDSGAEKIHEDEWGILYKKEVTGDYDGQGSQLDPGTGRLKEALLHPCEPRIAPDGLPRHGDSPEARRAASPYRSERRRLHVWHERERVRTGD
jgi:hypothetical protein